MPADVSFSKLPLLKRNPASPDTPFSGIFSGIFPSATSTKPATLPELYKSVTGPRRISTCCDKALSTIKAWSGEKSAMSPVSP
ncbi:Uncharacterised protein [Mycobacteroides abscessus subsp. massiliense]|nr:Uncharacterised protein [Mycobacteroides abscessus subsp. massiliense]